MKSFAPTPESHGFSPDLLWPGLGFVARIFILLRISSPSAPEYWIFLKDMVGFSWMKIRDVLKLLEKDGWYLSRTRGSHRQYKHQSKSGVITVAGKPGDDLAPGTLNSIFKQAGLKWVDIWLLWRKLKLVIQRILLTLTVVLLREQRGKRSKKKCGKLSSFTLRDWNRRAFLCLSPTAFLPI
jgi:predicted RNA binding protein YcfA (HicA-like mRNA interferase family)